MEVVGGIYQKIRTSLSWFMSKHIKTNARPTHEYQPWVPLGGGWRWLEMVGDGWRWLEIVGDSWRWLVVVGGGWRCLEVVRGGWRWLVMVGDG